MQTPVINILLKKRYHPKHFLFFFGALILSINAGAQGDLLLFPKRIVFENSKKSQTLNLANNGKDTVRYLISVVHFRMKQDGGFETVSQPDSGQHFADKYFRFFPRSVLLAPNEAQSVRIQVVNTAKLEAGEYRSHIYFRAEADKKPLGEEELNKDTSGISVRLVAVFGISIPVIIRVGEVTTKVNISDARFELQGDSIPSLKMAFKRTGNTSVYGDVSVDHISPAGKVTPVGSAKGMAVYTPNAIRYFALLLNRNAGVNYHSGKLRIAYSTQAEAKPVKIAETEFKLM